MSIEKIAHKYENYVQAAKLESRWLYCKSLTISMKIILKKIVENKYGFEWKIEFIQISFDFTKKNFN